MSKESDQRQKEIDKQSADRQKAAQHKTMTTRRGGVVVEQAPKQKPQMQQPSEDSGDVKEA